MNRSLRLLPLLALAVLSPSSSTGQYAPQTYVCQTQTFWCAIQGPPGYPDGTSCWCNTYWGPVYGYSINPARVPNAPQLPTPQRQQPGNPPPGNPPSGTPGDVNADDCYKGLGNCPGSFMKAAGRGPRSEVEAGPDRGSSKSSFANALQRMTQAAEDGFDDIRGALKRRGAASDMYESTVVPTEMDFCTIYLPRSSRSRYLACFPPDEMSLSQLVRLVTDALGREGSRSASTHRWSVGDVVVEVDREDPITLTVRPPRQ